MKTDKLTWKETSVAFGTISVLERYKLSPGCIERKIWMYR